MRSKRGRDTTPRRFWSAAELANLAALYPDLPTEEVARRLGRSVPATYGMAAKLGAVKSAEYLRRECRLQKGTTIGQAGRFPKGNVPVNKGVRRPGFSVGRMGETQFKKGQRRSDSPTWRPVGTILTDADGYLRIKVRERQPEDAKGWNPEIWPPLHHKVWREHKGPIPPKHVVVFRDRNRANCAIENLELISKAENARRNAMWNRYPPDLAKTIMANGALKRQIRRLANGKEQNQRPAGPSVRNARSAAGSR